MASRQTKIEKICSAWSIYTNPLRSLTKNGIETMLDSVRHGNDVRLQLAFKEMEMQMPIFGICLNKRIAGVSNRNWDIVPIDDSSKARQQAEKVKKIFKDSDNLNDDGLTDAIEHLCLASFRGRSAVKPFVDDDLTLRWKKLDNWNVLAYQNKLYWHPSGLMTGFLDEPDSFEKYGMVELPKDEVICLQNSRPIDIPGIMIYLRQLVGEDNWARAVEKYGIAQIMITAAEGTPDSAMEVWNMRAQQIFEGGSGVLPYGTDVKQLTDARGQDCFSAFVEHQMEMIVLLACGSTMGTLPSAGGLGAELANVQQKNFDSLVSNDCKKIQNGINFCALPKICSKLGEEMLCRFEYIEKDDTSVEQYMTYAKMAMDMGMKIDVKKFVEQTGLNWLKTEDDIQTWTPPEDIAKAKEWTAEEKQTIKED